MESTRKIKRNNGAKLSTDPQSVAARQRRHRISDKFKVLKSLVPGGSKMDTVSLLEEAINYVKFLKSQIWLHQTANAAVVVPNPQDEQTLNYDTSHYDAYFAANINNEGSSSGVYNLSNNYDDIIGTKNEEDQAVSYDYELPAPRPSELLAPFPYCYFKQEDEMQVISDIYDSVNHDYYN